MLFLSTCTDVNIEVLELLLSHITLEAFKDLLTADQGLYTAIATMHPNEPITTLPAQTSRPPQLF